jgi:hypothetical protein
MAIPEHASSPFNEATFSTFSNDTSQYQRYRIIKVLRMNQRIILLKPGEQTTTSIHLDFEVAQVYDIDEHIHYSYDMEALTVPIMFIEKYGSMLSHQDVLNNMGKTDVCSSCSETGVLSVRQCDGKFPPLAGCWYPDDGLGLQHRCRREYICMTCSDRLEDEQGYWLCSFCIEPSSDPALVWGTSTQPRVDMSSGTTHPLDPPSVSALVMNFTLLQLYYYIFTVLLLHMSLMVIIYYCKLTVL